MKFTVQSFVIGGNGKPACPAAPAAYIHAHFRVNGAVVFVELIGCAFLVDPGYIGSAHGVLRIVLQNEICTRICGVDFPCGAGILLLTFVHVIKDDRRSDCAGDVGAVEDQVDNRVGIVLGVLAQIHSDLSGGNSSGNAVGARLGDGDHRMGVCFLGGMLILRGAFSVRFVVSGLVIDDRCANIDGAFRILRGRLVVDRNPVVGKLDRNFLHDGDCTGGFHTG